MVITINCNETQCSYNHNKVCIHSHPHITKHGTGYTCLSRARNVVHFGGIPFGCKGCTNKSDIKYCNDICPIMMETDVDNTPEDMDFLEFKKECKFKHYSILFKEGLCKHPNVPFDKFACKNATNCPITGPSFEDGV